MTLERRRIYWLRFAFRKGLERETLHVVQFETLGDLNEALAELYGYPDDDFMLAASGPQDVDLDRRLERDPLWSRFRLKAVAAKAKRKIVKSAMDAECPPVDIPFQDGFPPEPEDQLLHAYGKDNPEPRYAHYRALCALVSLSSAVVAVLVAYLIASMGGE